MAMIKVVVKKEFLDRYTGKRHKVNDKLEVAYERLAEIRRSGDFVEVIKAESKEKK